MNTVTSNLTRLLEEINRQKRAYHQKVMTPDGEWTNFLRFMQTYDIYIDWTNLVIPEFVFSAVSVLMQFGIDPIELDIFKIQFEYRLPSLEEMLRGLNIVVERLPLDRLLSELNMQLNFADFCAANFDPSICPGVIPKCIFGQTRYGECYVDPEAMREFLKNTILAMFKRHQDWNARRRHVEALAKALDVSSDTVASVYNRIELMKRTYTELFTLNYSRLNVSKLAPDDTKTEFLTYDGKVEEVSVTYLSDAILGCMLNVAVLDQCFLTPDSSLFRTDVERTYESPPITDTVDRMIKRNISGYLYTPMALANYATGEERETYWKSRRVETWGQLMAFVHLVDAFARTFAQDEDVFTQNMYANALKHLIGLVKRHGWGHRVFELLTDEETKTYWITYWKSMGLDESKLNELYERSREWILRLMTRKIEIGEAVKKRSLLI